MKKFLELNIAAEKELLRSIKNELGKGSNQYRKKRKQIKNLMNQYRDKYITPKTQAITLRDKFADPKKHFKVAVNKAILHTDNPEVIRELKKMR